MNLNPTLILIYQKLIINIFNKFNGKILVTSNTSRSKTITSQIAIETKSSLITNS